MNKEEKEKISKLVANVGLAVKLLKNGNDEDKKLAKQYIADLENYIKESEQNKKKVSSFIEETKEWFKKMKLCIFSKWRYITEITYWDTTEADKMFLSFVSRYSALGESIAKLIGNSVYDVLDGLSAGELLELHKAIDKFYEHLKKSTKELTLDESRVLH